MTYSEAITWLEMPDNEFRKAEQGDFSQLMKSLGDPQESLRFVHVTGSNGKGSICAMLAAVLKESGYRTGSYTSPHISVYNERCCINGEMISNEVLAALASRVKAAAKERQLSLGLFYKMTAIAFLYFAQEACDIVVLEVGRGGRHDCTNIIRHTELCVIGAISLEHTEVLGHTIAAIAGEKCGIFKPGASAVMLHQTEEAEEEARRAAEKAGIPLVITEPESARVTQLDLSGQTVSYRSRNNVRLSCPGTYQTENLLAVLDAVDRLKARGFGIPEEALLRALENISWPGRFEILQNDPLLLIDGAHNAGAVPALCEALRTFFPGKKFVFVLTLLADRPWPDMLEKTKPLAERYIAVATDDPKTVQAGELASYIRNKLGVKAEEADGEEEAVRIALERAGSNGCICVFGSIYLAGAVRDIMKRKDTASF